MFEGIWKKVAYKSLEKFYEKSGGDAIAINAQPGQTVDFEPVLYKSPEQCDDGEMPGWHVKGRDKIWHAGKQGHTVDYLGRVPTVLLEDDAHSEAGWLEPRIGEAIEMDNYWPIFQSPTFLTQSASAEIQTTNGAALADGGMSMSRSDLELVDPGEFSGDCWIDIDSPGDYDGMLISAKKAREWQAENTDSEHMQMQEDRGYLRGLASANQGPGIVKLMLLCAAIILGTLFIVLGLPMLIDGDAASGGMNPLIATVAGL